MMLTAVNSGVIDTLPLEKIHEFMQLYLNRVREEEQTIVHDIELLGVLNDDEKYFLVRKAESMLQEFMSIKE